MGNNFCPLRYQSGLSDFRELSFWHRKWRPELNLLANPNFPSAHHGLLLEIKRGKTLESTSLPFGLTISGEPFQRELVPMKELLRKSKSLMSHEHLQSNWTNATNDGMGVSLSWIHLGVPLKQPKLGTLKTRHTRIWHLHGVRAKETYKLQRRWERDMSNVLKSQVLGSNSKQPTKGSLPEVTW